jgi:O-succinylbenzoate synthase
VLPTCQYNPVFPPTTRFSVRRLRLREPFRTSSGMTHERRILLVRLGFDEADGIGECVAGERPDYSPETVETATLVIRRYLAGAVIGRTYSDPTGVADRLDRAVRGHPMARAAIEMAAWDAFARYRGVSLAELLGGRESRVPAGVSLGIQDDVARLVDQVEAYLSQGYRRIKLKIAPGKDLATLDVVRARFPDTVLTVDANAAYGADDMDRLIALDDYGLDYVEQPFQSDALLLHARLQERLETPICLDESITSVQRCRESLELGACRVVNIKPGRVGGHHAARQIHDLCAGAGVPVWCGGMLESGIGRAHNVALASLPNMRLPGDTSASDRYWERDVVDPPFVLDPDGMVPVPTAPGIGVALDEPALQAAEVDRVEIGRDGVA